jgi:hypothetical protein
MFQLCLCQNRLCQTGLTTSGKAGKAEVAALELVGELRMVSAQAVDDGGLQIVDMDRIFGDLVSVVVGFAKCDAALARCRRQPSRW